MLVQWSRSLILIITTVGSVAGFYSPMAVAFDDALFRETVAPILQKRCLNCHNDRLREGDFSVESAKSLFQSGFVIPNDSAGSHLLSLVTPTDGKAAMPKDAKALSSDEVSAIKSWIDSGAVWPANDRLHGAARDFDWWSFQPLRRPEVPTGSVSDPWCQNSIDAFILKQQRERNLGHNQEADRRTLIRRLTFDLTGLPPTMGEVIAFENDRSSDAYERLVDRLLASKHYGERWARHWLDVVQYADTCGYDKDKLRPNAWPYRDYVIRSFNEDKLYARFVQEQIAGDVLFPETADGIIGLGFIAAGPWDFIGHVEVPESKIDGKVARNLDRDNMVANTLNTFCSVTIQCARCHDHKFDPFTQQDYYSAQAIFAAVDRADRSYDTDPETVIRRSQLTNQIQRLSGEITSVEQQLQSELPPQYSKLNQTLGELKRQEKVAKTSAFGYHSQVAPSDDETKWVAVQLPRMTAVSRCELSACHDEYAGIGAGFGFPVRYRVEVTEDDDLDNAKWATVADRTDDDVVNPGLAPVRVVVGDRKIRALRVVATKLAERKQDFIFALAEIELFDSFGNRVELKATGKITAKDSIEAPVRWSKSNLIDGEKPQSETPEISERIAETQRTMQSIQTKGPIKLLAEKKQRLITRKQQVQKELDSLPAGKLVYAATTDFPVQGQFKPTKGQPRPIHVLLRGDVERPAEVVKPGLLPLHESDSGRLDPALTDGERRAALARWLTAKRNPLVWRSIVNRIWQYHFGTGLVATPNDFGRMGSLPSHPELLDWLACEFRDEGQSMKQLHRLIVTSNTYRQSSNHHAQHASIDSGNQFLWRVNRRRLSAEEVRDSMLAVSGALDLKMGGPGFYLFELEHPQHSPHYEYHKFDASNPESHRRSIYRFIARSQPNPWMTTLDCADSSQSTPKRNETLTSLQALSLMNNQFVLTMARHFANDLKSNTKATFDGDGLVRIVYEAVQRTLQRSPTERERQLLISFTEEHGVENLCRVLFNHSEFVFAD